ncbi:alpha/beta hydrolase-fold protein [Paenibacillus sp. MMS20-IR301]|uniref:alpha/beta hydrolase n=1 Tax=Paenibacillus sp. MMS20-IR301 TaxID=2895946 RepID=UPI0028E4686D|nr:alpha/beta hydrolase-fold protein [Paenibacillus sp. MMS20-IR301]WNS44627.1 alpha/beta hydrolase-fold protein [Paenibacillus sp. MMS20-IR301]
MSHIQELNLLHPGCEEHIIFAGRRGLEYRILISQPSGEAPPEGYPVIYALDGHAVFHTLAESARLQTRKPHGYDPVVIVGIGYPSGEPFDMLRRCYDFTMPAEEDKLPKRPDGTGWPESGGADDFLTALEKEIMPFITGKFPVDSRRQALFGHSLGGLLVLHALFKRPGLFTHYAAGSPSVWWNDYALLTELEQFSAAFPGAELERKLMITIGADELEQMVEDAAKLPGLLSPLAGQGLQVSYYEFAGESHVSVLPAALSRLLRFALEQE